LIACSEATNLKEGQHARVGAWDRDFRPRPIVTVPEPGTRDLVSYAIFLFIAGVVYSTGLDYSSRGVRQFP
jgi:hypothetical protein